MDNITHTLFGLAVGQGTTRWLAHRDPKAAKRIRVPIWVASAAANNFPDLDFLYASRLSKPFGYILHHRGFTHTFVAAIPESAILLALFWIFAAIRKLKWTPREWIWIALACLLGPVFHIGMDYLNSYGVHPFWPFENRWHYGDAVFIVEPLIWIIILPLLIFESESKTSKQIFGVLFAGTIGLCLFTGYVPWQLALVASVGGLWLIGLIMKLKSDARVVVTVGLLALVIGGFLVVSHIVKAQLTSLVQAQFPESTIYDLVVSPFPANPLCWSVMIVETNKNGSDSVYVARRGVFAILPHVFGVAECPEFMSSDLTPPLKKVSAPLRPELIWSGQFEAPLKELTRPLARDCDLQALMKFVRVPFWTRENGDFVVGDLRFARSQSRGFAKFAFSELADSQFCPSAVPPWVSPREDLF